MDRLDPSALRARFPALSRTLDGRRCVFADAPGGTQVPETVIEAMAAYLRTSNANVHGAFVTSIETDHLIEEAHRAGSDLLGCHADEIVFGPNATTLLFALSRSIARTLGPGDEIVVTRLDHDANIRPWLMVAEDTGATVRWVDIRDDDVTIDRGSFEDTLTDGTKVVAFTLASNAVGTVTPAAELARAAHDAGALVVCDGVHVAQHRLLDVHAIGADVVVCSPYKIFGPHLGILFGRRELLESWRPYKVRPASEDLPYRWETGTQNHEGFAGFVAAVDYLADVGRMYGNPSGTRRRDAVGAAFEAIGAHEATLSRRFLDGVGVIDDLRLYGIAEPDRVAERTPTFAVRLGDQHPLETAKLLGERGIFVWDGHYYALELMERLGLQESGGAVRVGFCHYNTAEEVDRVLAELASLA
ncbi:MAG: cysteine desulfurase-like protein [Actinobacteria bacterium]|nr:MAG: cysteine desulfurase-like protein [Actinomycetota bacterium]